MISINFGRIVIQRDLLAHSMGEINTPKANDFRGWESLLPRAFVFVKPPQKLCNVFTQGG